MVKPRHTSAFEQKTHITFSVFLYHPNGFFACGEDGEDWGGSGAAGYVSQSPKMACSENLGNP